MGVLAAAAMISPILGTTLHARHNRLSGVVVLWLSALLLELWVVLSFGFYGIGLVAIPSVICATAAALAGTLHFILTQSVLAVRLPTGWIPSLLFVVFLLVASAGVSAAMVFAIARSTGYVGGGIRFEIPVAFRGESKLETKNLDCPLLRHEAGVTVVTYNRQGIACTSEYPRG